MVVASAITVSKIMAATIILHLEEGLEGDMEEVRVEGLEALVQAVTKLHKFTINIIIVTYYYLLSLVICTYSCYNRESFI